MNFVPLFVPKFFLYLFGYHAHYLGKYKDKLDNLTNKKISYISPLHYTKYNNPLMVLRNHILTQLFIYSDDTGVKFQLFLDERQDTSTISQTN